MILAIISILVFNAIAFFPEKRMNKLEIYSTSIFAVILAFSVDYILEVTFHLYGYFQKKAQYTDLLVTLGIYPAIDIIFLNFFPSTRRFVTKTLYIAGWSAFALFYEWLSVKLGLFYYNGWKWIYSVPIYPFLYLLLLGNLKLVRRLWWSDVSKEKLKV
ncbi:CBO0543 family protein [Fictibacillus sp. Mic-4]|uniref:CBO0543 family protein n=1 Tax=Fictibacillus sp. Mic-4 TaxID=3132826 RepID=UPI003CF0A5C7